VHKYPAVHACTREGNKYPVRAGCGRPGAAVAYDARALVHTGHVVVSRARPNAWLIGPTDRVRTEATTYVLARAVEIPRWDPPVTEQQIRLKKPCT
jgi:hypothetical protein